MFQLTREVRFAINASSELPLGRRPTNTFGGYPSLVGFGLPMIARVTLAGPLDPQSQYLLNIKDIDSAVLVMLPKMTDEVRRPNASAGSLLRLMFDGLSQKWPDRLRRLSLHSTPTLHHTLDAREPAMIRLSQKFEFSASHRLHNPSLDEDTNRSLFGKCNNPAGHGHNYEVQVTLRGEPDVNGVIADLPVFERLVTDHAIDKLDHRYLNVEVPEFAETIPSVENIAKVIFHWLAPVLNKERNQLASVTVWETSKTWCEYTPD